MKKKALSIAILSIVLISAMFSAIPIVEVQAASENQVTLSDPTKNFYGVFLAGKGERERALLPIKASPPFQNSSNVFASPSITVGNLLGQVYDDWPIGGPEEASADAWAGGSDPCVQTDSSGQATVKVAWQSACDSIGDSTFTFRLYVDGTKRDEKTMGPSHNPEGTGYLSYTLSVGAGLKQNFQVKWWVEAKGDAYPTPADDTAECKATLLVQNPTPEPSITTINSPTSGASYQRYEHVKISGTVVGQNTGLGAGNQVNISVSLLTTPQPPGYNPWFEIVQLTTGGYFEVDYFNDFDVPYIANPKNPDPIGYYGVSVEYLGSATMQPSSASVNFYRVGLIDTSNLVIVNPIWDYENSLFYAVILQYENTTYASPVPSASVTFNGTTKITDALGNVQFRSPDEYQDPEHVISASKNTKVGTSYIDIRNREPPQLPVAIFKLQDDPLSGNLHTFDGSWSYDREGLISSYYWSFGDGSHASGISVNHGYLLNDIYSITLTVTDNYGLSTSVTKAIYFSKSSGVGGLTGSVDKLGLLAPYIGLASTILVATVATTIYVKHAKRRKEE